MADPPERPGGPGTAGTRAVERGLPVAALTADLATENDARRLARSGAPVKQLLTDGPALYVGAWLHDRLSSSE